MRKLLVAVCFAAMITTPAAGQLPLARQLTEQQTAGPLFRPSGVRLTGDRVWITDQGEMRIVGVPLRGAGAPVTIGRRGSGPGEFNSAVTLHAMSDSELRVYGTAPRRLTVFTRTAAGDWRPQAALLQPSLPGLSVYEVLPLRRGHAVVFNAHVSISDPPPAPAGTMGVLARVDGQGAVQDTIVTFPLSGAVAHRVSTGPQRYDFIQRVGPPFSDAFSHSARTPACGGVIVISTGGRGFELTFVDGDGRVVGRERRDRQGEPVTREQFRSFLDGISEPLFRSHLERLGAPQRHAAIQKLVATRDGHVWVRTNWQVPANSLNTWEIWPLRRAGGRVTLGEPTVVRLPRFFHPSDAANGEVWGIEYLEPYSEPVVRAYRAPVQGPGPGC
jgi:hypothetical protein